MKRRITTGGKAGKAQPRKAANPERKTGRAAVSRGRTSDNDLQKQLDLRTSELAESRKQLTATNDVLQAISTSGGNLKKVFETVLGNATRLCEAKFGVLHLCEGENFRTVALHNAPKDYAAAKKRDPMIREVEKGNALDVVRKTLTAVQVADVLKERAYTSTSAQSRTSFVRSSGVRSLLAVPLVAGGSLIGVIIIYRQEVSPFSDKQIELVQNFAAQAVIAIENTRLLNELREALEQQTATADVLEVISRSPGELQSVFEAMLESATRICGAQFGTLLRCEEGRFFLAAGLNVPSQLVELNRQRGALPPSPGHDPLGRLIATKRLQHIADIRAEAAYVEGYPPLLALADLAGARTLLIVPMLKDDGIIGVLAIYRTEVRPFSDKQVALLQNFAAQAVIAIEYTRLLNELRQRTDDLSESLDRQTAMSKVLGVISSSPTDLEPVFQAIVESAARLCDAYDVVVWRSDGDLLNPIAHYGPIDVAPIPLNRGTPGGRSILDRQLLHIADLQAEFDTFPGAKNARVWGLRALLCVPLMREGNAVGIIALRRKEAQLFTDKQVELVTSFAAQAVIAIENTRLLSELRQRTDDLSESLEQQTATSEVLKVISSSPGELQPVFESLLDNATRICDAKAGNIYRWDGTGLQLVASHNTPAAFVEFLRRTPLHATAQNPVGRMLNTKSLFHTSDLAAQPPYVQRIDPAIIAAVELGGVRTQLSVPLLKENEFIGAITLWREEVRPFADKQIELVQDFAAQAVIAIENTRLLGELRQRTDDLSEALQQQTATADVLEVISRSAFDLQPVFETVVESSMRLCGADRAIIFRYDGEVLRLVAAQNTRPEFREWIERNPIRPGRHSGAARAALERRTIHVHDVQADPEYSYGAKNVESIRTILGVPILKGDELLGVIMIFRLHVEPFSGKQIALVESFADQAAIAIENVRLFDEVQKRTEELSESLAQQTATADVLKVISRSTFDLQTVLDTLTESATRLCAVDQGVIFLRDGDVLRMRASFGFPPEAVDYALANPMLVNRGSVTGRVALEGRPVHVHDVLADPEYTISDYQRRFGYRTVLSVPLLREGATIGVFALTRDVVEPFTKKQIELVSTFADQAVIAIENARLLTELRESLQQQTATADVLKVISRSTFELQPVFDTMAESAVRLCEAERAYVFRLDGQVLRAVASFNAAPEMQDWVYQNPIPLGRHSVSARAGFERRTVQVPDIQTDPEYSYVARDVDPIRTTLAVPMLKGDELIGTITIYRLEVKPFTENQIALMEIFADQAVIAIENARLFENLQTRTRELAQSLEDLQTAQDRLVQTQKLASLGQLTAGIAHEIKNPLNFVNNFSSLSTELLGELQEALQGLPIDQKARAEIDELTETLRSNLDKIEQHGKRADSIVKNMLLHSREGSGEHRPVDINAVVEESLNLAYHGARAEKQGFNITLERSFDPGAGEVDVFPQEITRVLLNLIANGFYAATKRKAEADDSGYEPTLAASTRDLGDRVEISIRDNGTGIPSDVKDKMFNPFFTTKPAGEGTGLGLSLSHDIIVKQHAGSIEVDTEPGQFTEFRIILRRTAASLAKSGGRA